MRMSQLNKMELLFSRCSDFVFEKSSDRSQQIHFLLPQENKLQ